MTLASSILASLLVGQQPPSLEPAALNQLSRFKAKGWISVHGGKGNRTYALTNVGRIVATVQAQKEATDAFIEAHREFLMTHDISGIPVHLLPRVGELSGTMIYNSQTSPLSATENFLSLIEKSAWLKGVSGHLMHGYIDILTVVVRAGKPVELVLSGDVIMDLPDALLDEGRSLPNFHLYEIETARVGLCCMDSGLSLGFPMGNRYDIASDLICGPEALTWGLELFEWYKKHATLIEQIKHTD